MEKKILGADSGTSAYIINHRYYPEEKIAIIPTARM